MHRLAALGLILAFTLAATPGIALADRTWIRQFGTILDDGSGGAVAVHGRNVYVSGSTDGVLPGQTSAGKQDAFVLSYDSRGQLRWTRQFGTTGDDQTRAGALAANAHMVVVAGSVTGALPGQTWLFGTDAFVRAYDPSGDVLWTRQFGSPQNDIARGVAIAKDGSIFVAGQTKGQPGQQTIDGFVMRLAPDGTVLWYRELGTSRNDPTVGVAVTRDAVFVSGHTFGGFPGFTNAGGIDGYVARFTLDGDLEWVTQFGTPADDFVWAVGVVGSTVFVNGHTLGAFPGETSLGNYDGFVAALGLDGQLRWVRQFGTAGCDMTQSLATDHEGAVVVGQVGGAPPAGAGCLGTTADAFARKYDVDGNVIWTMQLGDPLAADNLNGAALRGRDVYLSGVTRGNVGGVNAGGMDAFVIRARDHRELGHDHGEHEDDDEESDDE